MERLSEDNGATTGPTEVAVAPAPLVQQQVDLSGLGEVFAPWFDRWMTQQEEESKRYYGLAHAELDAEARQNRLIALGVLVSGTFILLSGALLFYAGRDATALDLITLSIGFGGAVLGGYGWGKSRAREERAEE